MSKLYKHGSYFYMNRGADLYGWNDLYYDYDCTKLLDHIYGKELYESSRLKEPPVLFRQEAIKNIVKANMYRNELRYMLWEIEEATNKGKYEFEIKLESPLSEDSFKCIELLGYTIKNTDDAIYRITI